MYNRKRISAGVHTYSCVSSPCTHPSSLFFSFYRFSREIIIKYSLGKLYYERRDELQWRRSYKSMFFSREEERAGHQARGCTKNVECCGVWECVQVTLFQAEERNICTLNWKYSLRLTKTHQRRLRNSSKIDRKKRTNITERAQSVILIAETVEKCRTFRYL